jgi:hypothetical protein
MAFGNGITVGNCSISFGTRVDSYVSFFSITSVKATSANPDPGRHAAFEKTFGYPDSSAGAHVIAERF